MLLSTSWTAPLPLLYGTVGTAILVVGYLLGGRYLVGPTPRNDTAIAVIITGGTAILGLIVLSEFSIEIPLSYGYGIVLGMALYHYLMKYYRATAAEAIVETPDRR